MRSSSVSGQSYLSRFYNHCEDLEQSTVKWELNRLKRIVNTIFQNDPFTLSPQDPRVYPQPIRSGQLWFGSCITIFMVDIANNQSYTFPITGFRSITGENANRYILERQSFLAIPTPLKTIIIACLIINRTCRILSIAAVVLDSFSAATTRFYSAELLVMGWFLGPILREMIEYASLSLYADAANLKETRKHIEGINDLIRQIYNLETRLIDTANQPFPDQSTLTDLLDQRNKLLRECDESFKKNLELVEQMDGWFLRLKHYF